MLRRVASSLARRHEVVHLSAAAQLAEQPPSSSRNGNRVPQPPPGATESVVFGSIAAAAAAARQKPSSGVPAVAKFLGFSSVLPFWVFSPMVAPLLPLDLLMDPSALACPGLLQVGYGAAILSFFGGVHWGLAMTNVGGDLAFKMADQRYMWSVLPCLMGWPTITMPVAQAAGIQVALFTVVYFVDRSWASKGLLPPWYMKMRLPLTLMAAGGLALTAATS